MVLREVQLTGMAPEGLNQITVQGLRRVSPGCLAVEVFPSCDLFLYVISDIININVIFILGVMLISCR